MKPVNIIFASLITLSNMSLADAAKSATLFSFGDNLSILGSQAAAVQLNNATTVYGATGAGPSVPDGNRQIRYDLANVSQSANAGITNSNTFQVNDSNSSSSVYTNVYRLRWDGSTTSLGSNSVGSPNLTQGPISSTVPTVNFTDTLNLTAQPLFQVSLLYYQFQGPSAFIQLYTTFYNNTTAYTLSSQAFNGLVVTPTLVSFDFGATAVDLSNVTAIDLTVVGTQNTSPSLSTDFQINIVQTAVPFEFSPVMGIGLLGAAWGANKLRKSLKLKSLAKATA
jgi:hypothetical protein